LLKLVTEVPVETLVTADGDVMSAVPAADTSLPQLIPKVTLGVLVPPGNTVVSFVTVNALVV
jgi:hypothetical protein